MDIIYLHDLSVDTVIGVYDWERQIRQTIRVDLDMAADVAKAAATDSIEDTLDYKAVAKRVTGFVKASEYQLVETLAERVAEVVLNEFNIGWLRVRISKQGAVRGSRDVGVIIERGNNS